METTYKKKDNNTIIINEVKPEKIIPAETLPAKEYDYAFLKKQLVDIQTQWDEQLVQKQKEIEEINTKRAEEIAFVEKLIAEADKLGVVEKPAPVEDVIPAEPI